MIDDLAIAAHVRALLQAYNPAEVTAHSGNVRIMLPSQKIKKADFATPQAASHLKERVHDDLVKEVIALAETVPDVLNVVCDIEMPRYS